MYLRMAWHYVLVVVNLNESRYMYSTLHMFLCMYVMISLTCSALVFDSLPGGIDPSIAQNLSMFLSTIQKTEIKLTLKFCKVKEHMHVG